MLSDPLKPDQIWQMALGELQLQLTSSTYNTWLGRTNLVAYEDGTFVIGVHNEYARDWLEHRLLVMVKRTLAGIVGQSCEARFVVWSAEPGGNGREEPAPVVAVEPMEEIRIAPPPRPDTLPDDHGWFPVSAYASRFWAPLLGRIAWRVYQIVREADKRPPKLRTEWTPARTWTAPSLASDVPCGKQALTGCRRGEGRQAGAFDRLAELDVGRIERKGVEPHVSYSISVLVLLPWLMPEQLAQLPEKRIQHERWMEKRGLL